MYLHIYVCALHIVYLYHELWDKYMKKRLKLIINPYYIVFNKSFYGFIVFALLVYDY